MIDYFDHIKWTSLWGPIQQNLEDSLIHWMVHIDGDVLNLFYKKKKKTLILPINGATARQFFDKLTVKVRN